MDDSEQKVQPGPIIASDSTPKTITIKESTLWKIGAGILIILLAAAIWTGGFDIREKAGQQAQLPTDPGKQSTRVSADDDPVLGDKNAPLTIIEFSDFQCPFCGKFFLQTEPLIIDKYIKTGKAKLVYRDFPLGFHENALPAALAAECADEQEKFWAMHDKIYNNQPALSVDNLKAWAKELGLDTGKFNSCLDTKKYKSEVQKDADDGAIAGVSGTPTFFIGNDKSGYEMLTGAQPFSIFEKAIEAKLS